ncbi:hypothetical protein Plhal304r1_c002g0005351 [Plasmopara halstedii]
MAHDNRKNSTLIPRSASLPTTINLFLSPRIYKSSIKQNSFPPKPINFVVPASSTSTFLPCMIAISMHTCVHARPTCAVLPIVLRSL